MPTKSLPAGEISKAERFWRCYLTPEMSYRSRLTLRSRHISRSLFSALLVKPEFDSHRLCVGIGSTKSRPQVNAHTYKAGLMQNSSHVCHVGPSDRVLICLSRRCWNARPLMCHYREVASSWDCRQCVRQSENWLTASCRSLLLPPTFKRCLAIFFFLNESDRWGALQGELMSKVPH